MRSNEVPRSVEELEPQNPDPLQQKEGRPLLSSRFRLDPGPDLKVDQDAVGERDDLLPSAVGPVAVGGNCVEGQAALQLSDDLLVSATPAHEPPESPDVEGEVSRHRRVFVGPVARVEQVELVVLPSLMPNSLAVDDHPDIAFPWLQQEARPEAFNLLVYPTPVSPATNQILQIQPCPEGDLDGIACAARFEELQHARTHASAGPAVTGIGGQAHWYLAGTAVAFSFSFFFFSTHMHENHLFALLPFLTLLVATSSRWAILTALVGFCCLVNMAIHDLFLGRMLLPRGDLPSALFVPVAGRYMPRVEHCIATLNAAVVTVLYVVFCIAAVRRLRAGKAPRPLSRR